MISGTSIRTVNVMIMNIRYIYLRTLARTIDRMYMYEYDSYLPRAKSFTYNEYYVQRRAKGRDVELKIVALRVVESLGLAWMEMGVP